MRSIFTDFTTDARGLIFLPVIEDGTFYLRETRALPGFILPDELIPFTINAESRRREHVLTVENTPAAGMLIINTCVQSGMPLHGTEFEVRHTDGRLVTGQILDGNQPNTTGNSPNLAANGNFLTDHRGRINLNHLVPGVYHVRQINVVSGYELDTTIHVVTVITGQQAVLQVANRPLSGLHLLHINANHPSPIVQC